VHAMGFPVASYDARRMPVDPEAGCPWAAGVPQRTKIAVEETVRRLSSEPGEEVWALTVDEIGSVFDGTPEGKRHVAECPHCAEAFRDYLRRQGLKPADFGVAGWEEITPFDSYGKDFKLASVDRATGLRAYHTGMFVNETTARLFTPLRDKLSELNRDKTLALEKGERDTAAAQRPFLYSYALRGNTFLMGGHSLDFFDFYRHADNAFVYETSNRDPRVWQWDSYLCDVGRVVSAERDLAFGIYVKPHRGAPIQRALSAVSRNATMLYWYTYGPDWAKGDTFAGDPQALAACSKAARMLAQGEDVLYGSNWALTAKVAVVFPRSSELWMRLSGTPPDRAAAYENAKWIYTALAHEHLPVDPLDEGMLAEKPLNELAQYRVIYVSGPNLTGAAADKLAKWVHAGGTLCTSGGGLRFDEANQPLGELENVLGLKARQDVDVWKQVELYKATALESWNEPRRQLGKVPDDATVTLPSIKGELRPVVGREALLQANKTETVASFADGSAAITRHAVGEGEAWVIGLFPGLEYSAPLRQESYDMSKEFPAPWRELVALPCRGKVVPVVSSSVPTVEGVLLQNPSSGRLALTLMNWTYRAVPQELDGKKLKPRVEFVPQENVHVRVAGVGNVRSVRSSAAEQTIPHRAAEKTVTFTLPRLEEGDILLIDTGQP
jgi:hypothetical protein